MSMDLIVNKKQQGNLYKINEQITAKDVRLISYGEKSGVYTFNEALSFAKEEGVDLIQINEKAVPIICKIMDFSKFMYEKSKQEKEFKKNSKNKPEKEIKVSPNMGEHDFAFKVKNAKDFILKGHRVKVYIQFKGREISFKDKGELVLLKFVDALLDIGVIDSMPVMNGKKMFVTVSPKAKK